MTEAEENVIQWACNLAEAIVAGDYKLPAPMCRAINELQDAVHDMAWERGWKTIKDGCSQEFLEYSAKYWSDLEAKLKKGAVQ